MLGMWCCSVVSFIRKIVLPYFQSLFGVVSQKVSDFFIVYLQVGGPHQEFCIFCTLACTYTYIHIYILKDSEDTSSGKSGQRQKHQTVEGMHTAQMQQKLHTVKGLCTFGMNYIYICEMDECGNIMLIKVAEPTWILSKMCSKARGMTPLCDAGSDNPCIVKDLPLPVCP